MKSRSDLVAKVQACGYAYYRQKKKVHLYRKSGAPYVVLPNKKQLTDDMVHSVLRQIGYSPEEIEEFMQEDD